jgi:phage shock protein E
MTSKWVWIVVAIVVVLVAMRGWGRASDAEKATVPEKLKQGAQVLDVRTPSEFAGAHYPGATNIPVQELAARIAELGDTNRAIVVYCRSGNRSAHATRILQAAGFRDVTNAGGLNEMPSAAPR